MRLARWFLAAFALAAAVPAGAQPKCQGRGLAEWIEAFGDLDPQFRKDAVACIARFGGAAVRPLSGVLSNSTDRHALEGASSALIRIGPEGRAVVSERLARRPDRTLVPIIDAIGAEGARAASFIAHLRTLSTQPDVGTAALRALATLSAAGVEAIVEPPPPPPAPAPSVTLTLAPFGCVVHGRFPVVRGSIETSDGATVTGVRVFLQTALGGSDEYYVEARVTGATFDATLPKPAGAAATAITFWAEAQSSAGATRTEPISAAVAESAESCEILGARALPSVTSPPAPVNVFRREKTPR